MKQNQLRQFAVLFCVVLLAVTLLLPGSASGQGRGRGRGLAKKQLKFVNGHDASAGRWDGRGPRRGVTVWTHRGRGHHRGWAMRRHRRM